MGACEHSPPHLTNQRHRSSSGWVRGSGVGRLKSYKSALRRAKRPSTCWYRTARGGSSTLKPWSHGIHRTAKYPDKGIPLVLEDLPNRSIRDLRMFVNLGVGHAFVEQPAVPLVQVRHVELRLKEVFADKADLVPDLPPFPA